jgi:hypothetical protein
MVETLPALPVDLGQIDLLTASGWHSSGPTGIAFTRGKPGSQAK